MQKSSVLRLACAVSVMFGTLLARASSPETVLYAFRAAPGACPEGGLVFDEIGNLYGSTEGCGNSNPTIFEMSRGEDGTWSLITLFEDLMGGTSNVVLDSSGNLYGTSYGAGDQGIGAVFELVKGSNGQWTENILYSFGSYPGDGTRPRAGVVFDSKGNVYGTTTEGGTYGIGTAFELMPNGQGGWSESLLYSFTGGADGSAPSSGLTIGSAGRLYGTTSLGGLKNTGTVFEITPTLDGWIQNVIHSFGDRIDGQNPMGGVTFDTFGNLYGTTFDGGSIGFGTVFELTPTGGDWSEAIIHRFNPASGDGTNPSAPITIDSTGTLYGVTPSGGAYGSGTAFRLTADSNGKWVKSGQYNFSGRTDGGLPTGSLTLDQFGDIFGATISGGIGGCAGYSDGCRVIFEIKQ